MFDRAEQFRLAIEASPTGMIMVGESGQIVLVNREVERLFGYARAELLGQSIEVLVPERMRAGHPRYRTEYSADPQTRAMGAGRDLFGRRKDGTEIPIEIGLNPLETEEGRFVLASVVDISARKRAEEELRHSNAELRRAEEALRRLNEQLEQRVQLRTAELEAANRELEAFTYSVSHDLRAPLRHVSGFARILMEEFQEELNPRARQYLDRILEGAHHMGRLVDDLLHLARIGRQAPHCEATTLGPMIHAVISDLAADAPGRHIEWRVAELPDVRCDPGLMRVVFTNLLTNAVKYTLPRAAAVIEVGETTSGGARTFFVRDNGVGFDMKYAGRLFGVFQRLHGAAEFEGTGVGLATVQRIIHKHGGRIWAEAEPDQGATFFFTLASHGAS